MNQLVCVFSWFNCYEPYANTTATGTTSTNALQYTGRENDGTGLYYNRARYYSSVYGRFVSEDPLHELGGSSAYDYAVENPIDFYDPLGIYPLGYYLPSISPGVASFALGWADSVSFGIGRYLRHEYESNAGDYNECSGAYLAGEVSSFLTGVAGTGRLGYAALSADIPYIEGITGESAVAARNSYKLWFRLGTFPNYKMYSYAEMFEKYGTDAAVIQAAGRTDMGWNIAGAIAAPGVGAGVNLSACGCK